MTKSRRRYVAKSRGIKPQTAGQLARAYVEPIYQALRTWNVVESEAVRTYEGATSGGRFRLIAGNWGSTSGPTRVVESLLVMPWGTVLAREVSLTIADLAHSADPDESESSRLLLKIQTGASPVSLLDPRGGWAPPKANSVAYALAVARLMSRLGQLEAEVQAHYLLSLL